MYLKERIKQLYHLYAGETPDKQPKAIALDSGMLNEAFTLASNDLATWFVIGPGYWGKGQTIVDAANECSKAGCRRSEKVSVLVCIGDNQAKLEGFSVIAHSGAAVHTIGRFERLSSLLTVIQP